MKKTLAALPLLVLLSTGHLLAATFEVETHIDAVVADNLLSLREAIQAANTDPGKDVIIMAETLDKDITLALGELLITDEVEINGSFVRAPVIGKAEKSPGIPPQLSPIIISGDSASRIFRIDSPSLVEIRDMILVDGFSEGGGGAIFFNLLNILNPDGIVLRNVTIRHCVSKGGGGAINTRGGSFKLIDCTIEENRAETDSMESFTFGGGIVVKDAMLELIDSDVINNRTDGDGGGVYFESDFDGIDDGIGITGGTISENMARDGGGLYIRAVASDPLLIAGTLISDNTAEEEGGGIYSGAGTVLCATDITVRGNHALSVDFDEGGGGLFNAGSVIIEESTFESNNARRIGGGIFNTDNGQISIDGGTISNNEALDGGGIVVDGGSVSLTGGDISDNTAVFSGGGVFVLPSGIFEATDTVIARNDSRIPDNPGGGGIFNGGNLVLHQTSILNNTASDTGATGGGIATFSGSVSNIIGGRFFGNRAGLAGGGLQVAKNAKARLENVEISSNEAQSSGGGLTINSQGEATIVGGIISSNTAEKGAGVSIGFRAVLYASGTEISMNIASSTSAMEGGGGAIKNDGGTVGLSQVTISDNTAETTGDLSGGGAILNKGILSVTDSLIVRNTSTGLTTGGGGLLNLEGAHTSVLRSTLSENDSDQGGGGFFNLGHLDLLSSTLSGSEAQSNGGGIYSGSGVVRIVNSTLSGNEVRSGNGGGITSHQNALIDLIHATVSGNHAATSGGGLHVSGGVARIGNSVLAGNTANVSSPDFIGAITSLDFNLIGDTSNGSLIGPISNSILDTNPLIGPLADNGGPTLTHDLLAGSPAIDSGSSGMTMFEGFAQDQRGFQRIADIDSVPNADGGVDMGSVEIIALEIEDEIAFENDGQIEFLVNISHAPPLDQQVTVRFDTASVVGGADATEDYSPISDGLLTFEAGGPTSQTIQISIVDDSEAENNETFEIILSESIGATILDSTATGTIIDNDEGPTPTATPSSVTPETPTPSPTPPFDYDVRPIPPDGIINALDLIEWYTRVQDGSPESEVLFDFARFWESQ